MCIESYLFSSCVGYSWYHGNTSEALCKLVFTSTQKDKFFVQQFKKIDRQQLCILRPKVFVLLLETAFPTKIKHGFHNKRRKKKSSWLLTIYIFVFALHVQSYVVIWVKGERQMKWGNVLFRWRGQKVLDKCDHRKRGKRERERESEREREWKRYIWYYSKGIGLYICSLTQIEYIFPKRNSQKEPHYTP